MAAASPLVLFFDNDPTNFSDEPLPGCGNVVCVAVRQSPGPCVLSREAAQGLHRVFEAEGAPELVDFGILYSRLYYPHDATRPPEERYDPRSGVSEHQMQETLHLLKHAPPGLVSDVVLDWDRTITMMEGLHAAPQFRTLTRRMKAPAGAYTPADLAAYLLGGRARAQRMADFLQQVHQHGVRVHILTRNAAGCPWTADQSTFREVLDALGLQRVVPTSHIHCTIKRSGAPHVSKMRALQDDLQLCTSSRRRRRDYAPEKDMGTVVLPGESLIAEVNRRRQLELPLWAPEVNRL